MGKKHTKQVNSQLAATERTNRDDPIIHQIASSLEDMAYSPSICDHLCAILDDNSTEYHSLITSLCDEITLIHKAISSNNTSRQSNELPVVTSHDYITFNQQLYSFLNTLECSSIERGNPKELLDRLPNRIAILDWLSAQAQAYRMLTSTIPVQHVQEESKSNPTNQIVQFENDLIQLASLLHLNVSQDEIDAGSLISMINDSLSRAIATQPSIKQSPLFNQHNFTSQQRQIFHERFDLLRVDLDERVAVLLHRYDLTMQAISSRSSSSSGARQLRACVDQLKASSRDAAHLVEYEVWCAGSELVEQQRRVGLVHLRDENEPIILAESGISNIPDRGGRMNQGKSEDDDDDHHGKRNKGKNPNRKRKLNPNETDGTEADTNEDQMVD